jgi:tRNA threonylcarbamoyladenosine biosynthesis protein TsaB
VSAAGAAASDSSGRLVLALETATPSASVALVRGRSCLGERALARERAVSEQLLPAIDALLGAAGFGLEDVDAFALSIGPGSFTGLRVGVATVKGLAFASGLPAVAVPTLEALAFGAPAGEGPVVALLDAQRGEVYGAAFERVPGGLRPSLPEGLYGVADLCARLPRRGTFVGDGATLHDEALRARLGDAIRLAGAVHPAPRARDVGDLAERLLAAGRGLDPARLALRYVRRAEAEARRTGERTEPEAGPDAPR